MRYSIEPRDRIYVKGYGFLSFARNMSYKYGQKIIDRTKTSATDAIKTSCKRATSEAAGDLMVIKLLIKITSVSKKKSNYKNNDDDDDDDDDVELTTHKKRYISPEKRKQIIEELRLVPNSNV